MRSGFTRVILRNRRKQHGNEAREHRLRRGVIASARVKRCGKAFVVAVIVAAVVIFICMMMMQPLVQIRRACENQRECKARQHRAEERETRERGFAKGVEHRGSAMN